MGHLRNLEIIELAGGRLGAEDLLAGEAHLEACAECRSRLEAARRTWQALGEWEVAPGRGLAARVVQAAGCQAQLPPTAAWRRAVRPVLRAAAAILLAAGIGHAAGRWACHSGPGSAAVPTGADEQAASEALSLDVLAYQSAAGLAESILDLDAPAEETRP